MTDIMQERITLIEDLTKKRQPITNMEAIYFITPTDASIARLLDDFRDPARPQYKGTIMPKSVKKSQLTTIHCQE